MKIRGLCEDASSSLTGIGTEDDGIALLSVNPEIRHTLDEFCHNQDVQAEQAKEKIRKLRKTVLEIVKQACEVGPRVDNPNLEIYMFGTSF